MPKYTSCELIMNLGLREIIILDLCMFYLELINQVQWRFHVNMMVL
jgi:hypothetical protein